eukprot:2515698-Rhodomonas_salina.7
MPELGFAALPAKVVHAALEQYAKVTGTLDVSAEEAATKAAATGGRGESKKECVDARVQRVQRGAL